MNRKTIIDEFHKYTDEYDSSDVKIKLKIEHTLRVAAICDEITKDLGLSKEDKDLAFAIGMLHDIARFEQVKRYNTFEDRKSIDHAELGISILFDEDLIKRFDIGEKYYDVIKKAIKYHNKYIIPEGLTDCENMFCKIIRDADKIDIIKVNVEHFLKGDFVENIDILKKDAITEEVFAEFFKNRAILHDIKRTQMDMYAGHISLCFELEFKISRIILLRQGYIHKALTFKSDNPDTAEKISRMREYMLSYLENSIR